MYHTKIIVIVFSSSAAKKDPFDPFGGGGAANILKSPINVSNVYYLAINGLCVHGFNISCIFSVIDNKFNICGVIVSKFMYWFIVYR